MILPQEEQSNVIIVKPRHPSFAQNDPGFQSANWQTAQQKIQRQSNRYQNGQPMSYSCEPEAFKEYGPGTYLFFLFARRITLLFLAMSVLCLPAIASNVLGDNLLSAGVGSSKYSFMRFSIANQAAKTTTETSRLYYYLVTVPDAVYSILFFLFLLNWNKVSDDIVAEMKKESQLPSYFTIQVHNKNITVEQLSQFMSSFGQLQQISEVKSFDESIHISKKISEVTLEMKTEQAAQHPDTQLIDKYEETLLKLYAGLTQELVNKKGSTVKFYVTFKKVVDRKAVLEKFQQYYKKCCICISPPPEDLTIMGELLKVKACTIQPGSIIWENVHITATSRFIRLLIQTLFVIVGIFAGFLILSFLNILTPMSSTPTVDVSNYTYQTVISTNNSAITQSWCLSQSPTTVYNDQQLLALCQAFLVDYYVGIGLSVAISVSVIVIKSLLKIFLTWLAKFQRYESQNQQVSSLIVNLFLTYTFTTFVITFLLQANLFKISFKTIINGFISSDYLRKNSAALTEYNDLTRSWYADIGYKIVINWVTFSLIPHIIQPLILLVSEYFAQRTARKQKIQRKMDQALELAEFNFEDCYANILLIVFVSLLLAGPMPLMILLGTVALGTRYLFWKYYFIRFCKIPPTFDESLNTKIMNILYWCVIIHLAISIFAYGNNEIFSVKNDFPSINQWLNQSTSSTNAFIKSLLFRMAINWLLTVTLVVVVVIWFFKTLFIDTILSLIAMVKKDKLPTVMLNNNQEFTPAGDRDFVTSYKMENNPAYDDIIAILKSFKKKV